MTIQFLTPEERESAYLEAVKISAYEKHMRFLESSRPDDDDLDKYGAGFMAVDE